MPTSATYARAAAAGLLSLATAGYSVAVQLEDIRLLNGHPLANLAPLPVGMTPTGGALPPAKPVLTVRERDGLARAIWRDPLDPKLFNLLHTEAIRLGQPAAQLRRQRELLSRLGWRYTMAQQNLLLQAAIDERYDEVIDRADALLRRQKLPTLSYELLWTLEAAPGTQAKVVRRLRGMPPWRRDYLSVVNPQTPQPRLVARVATMDALIAAPGGVSREEMAPSLVALAAAGYGRDAYRVWLHHIGRRDGRNLIYDPEFGQAAALAGTADLAIPFEWRLNQDLGYAAQVATGGITINWDGRGVPVFLSQAVPVIPSQRYALSIQGRSSVGSLSSLLAPALSCGVKTVPFVRAGNGPGEASYQSGPLPSECDMAILTVAGALDSGMGSVDMNVTRIVLQRAD